MLTELRFAIKLLLKACLYAQLYFYPVRVVHLILE